MKPPTPRAAHLYGCGTILFTLAVMCVLLLANSLVTAAIFRLLGELGWTPLQQAQRAQAFLLFTPLVVMIIEWWLIDWIVDLLVTHRDERERRKAAHFKSGVKREVHTS
jgi:hypothetical protein